MELNMNRLFVLIAAASLMLGTAVAQDTVRTKAKSGGRSGNAEQQVKDLEMQWAKDSKASNGDAVGAVLADDFVEIDSDGSMRDKPEFVSRTHKAKWDTNEVSDLNVHMHGSTALVTGTWKGKGTSADGKPLDGTERFADTWMKMPNGKWQCVASASAPVKAE
jgi:ketosteroid isomerase-like protein